MVVVGLNVVVVGTILVVDPNRALNPFPLPDWSVLNTTTILLPEWKTKKTFLINVLTSVPKNVVSLTAHNLCSAGSISFKFSGT